MTESEKQMLADAGMKLEQPHESAAAPTEMDVLRHELAALADEIRRLSEALFLCGQLAYPRMALKDIWFAIGQDRLPTARKVLERFL